MENEGRRDARGKRIKEWYRENCGFKWEIEKWCEENALRCHASWEVTRAQQDCGCFDFLKVYRRDLSYIYKA